MRRGTALYAELMASTAIIELKSIRSCLIISIARSAVTKRASGVSSGTFVHQDYRAVLLPKELSTSDGRHQGISALGGAVYFDCVSNQLMPNHRNRRCS